jgi:type IV secretion system protein TrbL
MGCPGWSNLDPRCHLKEIATDAFEKMARSFASAAAGAAGWLWRQIGQATTINLSSPGITKDLIATGAIALVLCTGLFVIQVITATLRREPGGLVRAVRGLGVATIMSGFAIAATKILLAAVDDLSSGVVRYATGGGIDGLGSRFALSASLAQMQNPAGLLLFSIVVLAAVVIVWAAMMMRKLLIIVAAVMTPLAFAGGAADITRSWVRRWIEFTAALIASKLLLVVMLMVGLSVFEGAGMQTKLGPGGTMVPTSATQAGTQLATGSVLLLLAGFAPWIAIKMFHFAGDSLHAVHAQAAAAHSGTQTIVAAPRKVSNTMATGRSLARNATPSTGATPASSGRMPEAPNASSDGAAINGATHGRTATAANPGAAAGAAAAAAPVVIATGVAKSAASTAEQASPGSSAGRERSETNAQDAAGMPLRDI